MARVVRYLVKKYREGARITRHAENSMAQDPVDKLFRLENEPIKVLEWINLHRDTAFINRMKQTIRARRKRHFVDPDPSPGGKNTFKTAVI